jgi:hypothetical protein
MPPTQGDERSGLVDDLIKRGASDDDINKALAEFDGVPSQGATPPTNVPGLMRGATERMLGQVAKETLTEQLPRGAVAFGAGIASGALTTPMKLIPALLSETGIVGTADLAYQGIRKLFDVKREIDPIAALKIGATSAATTGVVRTGMDFFANRASIAPQFVRAMRNPKNLFRWNRTFGEAAPDAELLLGDEVKTAFKTWDDAVTAPRLAKKKLLDQATAAGVKINSQPIVDALEDVKLSTPKTAAGKAYNRQLTEIQDGFHVIRKVAANPYAGQGVGGPTTGTPAQAFKSVRTDLTPTELDEFMTKEIDSRIYAQSGSPKDTMLSQGLANARKKVREELLNSLPPEARELTAQTFEELTMQEEVEKAIKPGMVSLETKMINLFKPGHGAELRAIRYLGEKTGVPFEEMAFKIAQQRQFSGDPRIRRKALDFLSELLRGISNVGLKGLVPAHPLLAPAAGAAVAGSEEGKRLKKLRSANLPLQTSHLPTTEETP